MEASLAKCRDTRSHILALRIKTKFCSDERHRASWNPTLRPGYWPGEGNIPAETPRRHRQRQQQSQHQQVKQLHRNFPVIQTKPTHRVFLHGGGRGRLRWEPQDVSRDQDYQASDKQEYHWGPISRYGLLLLLTSMLYRGERLVIKNTKPLLRWILSYVQWGKEIMVCCYHHFIW